jgi:PIN domain-containing protein
VPTVALALTLGGDEGRCGIWTSDQDLLGCGVPTWTTETLLAHLRYQRGVIQPVLGSPSVIYLPIGTGFRLMSRS